MGPDVVTDEGAVVTAAGAVVCDDPPVVTEAAPDVFVVVLLLLPHAADTKLRPVRTARAAYMRRLRRIYSPFVVG